jgi:hypothetical protein
MHKDNASIHIALRFHANFYHSYRGDTADELGFGKDIRIIRRIIEVLDDCNARGIPVRATWDFENYFSLQLIMPAHCPDIIDSISRRTCAGTDEMQVMSYNNGMMNAHTAAEFEAAIGRAISNPDGSGVQDIFGSFAPMVRPQEMMYTPSHLSLYPRHGIKAISLYYSVIPFNGFSAFVPPLSVVEKYNPLWLTAPGVKERMILVPAYNPGDLIDNISLRRWVKRLRREQLRMSEPIDLLILLDMDADDEFWYGIEVPLVSRVYSLGRGLRGIIESVIDLEYVRFTTPCAYLESHGPVGTVSIGQDTADGSFDGMASWAEKWENQRLWTGVERSRLLELHARRLMEQAAPGVVRKAEILLNASFEERLRSLSSTHFGMAAPVMNWARLRTAADTVRQSVEKSSAALERLIAGRKIRAGELHLLDFTRGVDSGPVRYGKQASRALFRVAVKRGVRVQRTFSLVDSSGRAVPSALLADGENEELCFVADIKAGAGKSYRLETDRKGKKMTRVKNPVRADKGVLANEHITLSLNSDGSLTGLSLHGEPFLGDGAIRTGITYAKKRMHLRTWEKLDQEVAGNGLIGVARMYGEMGFGIGETHRLRVDRELLLAAGMPYLYVTQTVHYPRTPFHGYNPGRAERLQRKWDTRWNEVWPLELEPIFRGNPGNGLRVWKHNYMGHMSSYELDYGRFSKNRELDSCNNHITNGWVAVSNGTHGLLVAQTADVLCSLAFCPLRTRREGDGLRVMMNPFGSYTGRQYRYPGTYTGLGWMVAVRFSASDHIAPYAPSFNGKTQRFRLMIAPYRGDAPPENIRADALAFAYPYLAIGDGRMFANPENRTWTTENDEQ